MLRQFCPVLFQSVLKKALVLFWCLWISLNTSVDYYGEIFCLKCWFDWFNYWESILKLCLTDFSLCQRLCRFEVVLLCFTVKLLNRSLWYTSSEKDVMSPQTELLSKIALAKQMCRFSEGNRVPHVLFKYLFRL